MRSAKFFTLLAAGLVMSAGATTSAQAAATIIASGVNGGTLVTIGTQDAATNVQYRPGSTGPFGLVPTTSASGVLGPSATAPQNPYAVDPARGYAAPLPGSEWLSPYVDTTSRNQPASVAPAGTYKYDTRFILTDSSNSLIGQYYADTTVTNVIVDGRSISWTPGTASTAGTFGFGSNYLRAGVHTLTFTVFNPTANSSTALDFRGVLAPEPAEYLVFAIAFGCIGLMMVRARKRAMPNGAAA